VGPQRLRGRGEQADTTKSCGENTRNVHFSRRGPGFVKMLLVAVHPHLGCSRRISRLEKMLSGSHCRLRFQFPLPIRNRSD
jgi:hypothetical protein